MLRALLIGSTFLFSLSALASTVECSNPEMGTLTIVGSLNDCRVTLEQPLRPWFSSHESCGEFFDGASYKMSAKMYSWGLLEPAVIVITRGTTADIQSVQWSHGNAFAQFGRHELSCTLK